ncbi:MAG: molybdenum cofactor guanylyltransferase [Ectothiorhodospiraceae bacterium]|nr:molybdenum cofactor guanylyltransferase [Ectothiorhodospiraceae bacterium]
MTNNPAITGLILAGGRARRMDGQDKGLLPLEGKCLIEHGISRLTPQVQQLLISANRNIDIYSQYGYPVLQDQYGDYEGPLSGLLRAFQYTGGENTDTENTDNKPLLVIPCDAPLLPTTLANRLTESLVSTSRTAELWAAIPHDGTRLQPLFGLYMPAALPSLKKYLQSGQRKVETWATALPHTVVDFSDEKKQFMNINTENDLIEAKQWLPEK